MNGSLRHVAVALLTAASLIVTPAFAQAQEGQNQSQAQQQQGQNAAGEQPASQPGAQTGSASSEPARNMREGMGADYPRASRCSRTLSRFTRRGACRSRC